MRFHINWSCELESFHKTAISHGKVVDICFAKYKLEIFVRYPVQYISFEIVTV